MLSRLSIRDIVLIDRLDIDFAAGLSVLTGETGAGKSILLDAFSLALGGARRRRPGAPRRGAGPGDRRVRRPRQPSGRGHPSRQRDIDDEGEMILRRVQIADGRTRAFVNDQPVSVQTLKATRPALVEIHGQHDDRALVDAATHRRLLDAFGGLDEDAATVEALWDGAPRRAGPRRRAPRRDRARRTRGRLSAPRRR